MGLCLKLQKMTGIDRGIFQVAFFIWFLFNGWALAWYIILALLLA